MTILYRTRPRKNILQILLREIKEKNNTKKVKQKSNFSLASHCIQFIIKNQKKKQQKKEKSIFRMQENSCIKK